MWSASTFFFLFVTGTYPGGLNPFYSCFFIVDLENIFLRSQTLFKKVAVKRCLWYTVLVAAKACFYKTAKHFLYVKWHTEIFCLLRFCASFYKFWPLTYVCHLKVADSLILSALSKSLRLHWGITLPKVSSYIIILLELNRYSTS